MSGHQPPARSRAREDEGWGPAVTGGARRRRPLRTALVILLVLVLAVVGFGVAVAFRASAAIERIPVDGLRSSPSGVMNLLVVGSDSRAGLTDEERNTLSTGSADGERTDTIFVMQVGGGQVAMLAFPRDLYVQRCDGSQGRINAAIGIGGAGCLVETVSGVSGIPIDHFVEVQFGGFRDIVDAVGGVEVCLDQPIQDDDAGIDLPAGCQVLDGADALGFVRVRKIDSDLERIERQQQFLGNLAETMLSRSTVLNPVRVWKVSAEIGAALVADEGLGPVGLGRLAWNLRGLAGGGAATFTVPADPASVGGASVLTVREDEAEGLFRRFRDGSVLRDGDQPTVEPADVEVRVLNGAGVAGLAGRTAEQLEAAGYAVTGVGNAEATATTTVLHPPGAEPGARLLAGHVRQAAGVEASVQEDGSVAVVTLVLGQDLASSD